MKRLIAAAAAALVLGGAVQAQPAAASAASASASIPFKQDKQTPTELSGRVFASLLVCLLVGGAVVYLLRRRGLGGLPLPLPLQKARRVQLLEVQRIGMKHSLVLVRWDDEELLLGQSEGRMDLVARKRAGMAAEEAR